jgi:hypothetical protein
MPQKLATTFLACKPVLANNRPFWATSLAAVVTTFSHSFRYSPERSWEKEQAVIYRRVRAATMYPHGDACKARKLGTSNVCQVQLQLGIRSISPPMNYASAQFQTKPTGLRPGRRQGGKEYWVSLGNTQVKRGYHISISDLTPSCLCRVSSPFSLRQQSPGPHPQTSPQSRTVSTRWASGRPAE